MKLVAEEIIRKEPTLVKTIDSYGYSPLHYAALVGDVKICCLLMEKGANIASRNISGETPLLVAAEQGHADVINALLEKGMRISYFMVIVKSA